MEQRLSNSDRESSCKDIDFILQVVYDGLAIWVTKSSTKTYVLDRERRSRSDETISRGERRSHASEADEHTRFHESTSQAQLLKVVRIVNWLGSYGLPVYQPSCTQIV
jgi:hypothetical protein